MNASTNGANSAKVNASTNGANSAKVNAPAPVVTSEPVIENVSKRMNGGKRRSSRKTRRRQRSCRR
jgi:hypothetical protein